MKRTLLTGLLGSASLIAMPAFAQHQEPAFTPVTERSVGDGTIPNSTETPITQEDPTAFPGDGAVMDQVTPRTPIVYTGPQESGSDEGIAAPNVALGTAPYTQVYYDTQGSDHWAISESYKARINSEGFTYAPFFGSQAPKTFTLHMSLGSATLGGKPISLDSSGVVTKNEDRFTIDRGPIDTWYDMSVGQVEQSFALETAGVNAELVLNIDVDTELGLQLEANGLVYSNEHGSVTYRHCVVYDGAGRRLELPIQASEGSIQLVVPASFMAKSVAPVVVDPIINTGELYDTQTRDLWKPDVAFDTANNLFAYTYERIWAVGDHDIIMETYGGISGAFEYRSFVATTFADENNPQVANDNNSDQFLVAFRYQDPTSMLFEISGRTINADTGALSPRFTIAPDASNYENLNLDVGGKSQGSSLFIVVWEREFNTGQTLIRSSFVTPQIPHSTGTAPTATNFIGVSTGNDITDSMVRVSESSGPSGVAEWRIMWVREDNNTNGQSVWSRVYNDDSTVKMATTQLTTISSSFRISDMDVSEGLSSEQGPSGDPLYMFALYYIVNNNEWVIICFALSDDDILGGGDRINQREHVDLDFRPRRPAIATLSNRFTMAYTEFDFSGYKCYTTALDVAGNYDFAVNERRILVRNLGGSWDSQRPAAASRYSGGLGSRFVGSSVGQIEAEDNIYIATVSAPRPLTPGVQYCTGNENSSGVKGFITMTGNTSTTSNKILRAESLPLNQFGYFLTSLNGTGTIQPPGSMGISCVIGGPLGRYNRPTETFFTAGSSSRNFTIDPTAMRGPTGNNPAVAGQRWTFQCWHRENGGTSNFTNAIALRFE